MTQRYTSDQILAMIPQEVFARIDRDLLPDHLTAEEHGGEQWVFYKDPEGQLAVLDWQSFVECYFTWDPYRFTAVRLYKRLTVADVARAIGVSDRTVRYWSHPNGYAPSPEHWQALNCLLFLDA